MWPRDIAVAVDMATGKNVNSQNLGGLLRGQKALCVSSSVVAWCLPLLLMTCLPSRAEAQAQSGGVTPAGGTAQTLDAALARLARNPRDVDSLIAAGRAALVLGDTSAATGFFTRADKLAPATPRVLAGLAVAKVRSHDPLGALPLFDMADTGGAISADDMTDRGLAYDLVGDNRKAQALYRSVLAKGGASAQLGEASRRLVLSCAIAGDREGSEAALRPLLAVQDRAGVRTQAFALAILGREDDAVSVVQVNMPADLATAIAPYLRYMRKLTPAQQAAAANLGEFPHAADIGVDDPRIAQYAIDHHLRRDSTELAHVSPGEAAGARGKGHAGDRARRKPTVLAEANPSPPEPVPSREDSAASAAVLPVGGAPAPAGRADIATPRYTAAAASSHPYGPVENETHGTSEASGQVAMGAPAPAPVAAVSVPVVQPVSASVAPSATVSPAPAPASAPARRRINFADAFATMGENAPVFEPAPGAVDIRKIAPARAPAKPPVPPKAPPPPAHPSRIWVELGVGRDTDRLGFDWHRLTRDDPELFSRRKPFVTGWARTNRLLTGPFDTQDAADTFVQKLRKAGRDGVFVWTSPAGQVVDPLDAR